MEINGLANIHVILFQAIQDGKIDADTAEKMGAQLVILERYMLAYSTAMLSNFEPDKKKSVIDSIPPWHEVRDNPQQFKRINGK